MCVGALYSSRLPDLLAYDAMHLEWWTNDFQFSSLTTCLFWVFNRRQCRLATVCFLQEKRLPQLPAAGHGLPDVRPFPFVGLVIFMVVRGIVLLAQRQKGVLQSAFSPANVLVLVVVLSITPVIWPITPLATAFWAKLSPGTRQRSRLLAKTF